MKRFPAGIMCTCVVPRDEQGRFIEPLFVDEVRAMLTLTPYLYVFGTAGEGHAVSDRQFQQIVRVFRQDAVEAPGPAVSAASSAALPGSRRGGLPPVR